MVEGQLHAEPPPGARARGLTIRVGIALAQQDESIATLWHAVEAMEELGYDSVWLSDTAARDGLAPLPALAAIAARTERLKLGTSVLVLPPRSPVLLARELATVDALSNGRLLPAAGLGLSEPAELAALGVLASERAARLEEAVQVIKLLWSGQPVSYEGRFTTLEQVRLTPKPRRQRLELWLGGRAKPALRRAGRIADGWLASFVSPPEFARGRQTIEDAAAQAGRTIDDDHYGTTIFATETKRADTSHPALQIRADLDLHDHFAAGPDALVQLLERFTASGASKFVVVPVCSDVRRWLHTMREAIAAFES